MALKRSIGTWGMLFAALGGIMGSGWLFGPYFAAKMAGPAAVIAWLIGGVLMMVVALTFAELSSTFPVVGGTVRFLELSHGSLVSFTMAWISWLSSVAVAPIETLALIHYASNYIPVLMVRSGHVYVLSSLGLAAAAVVMFIMCVLNVFGVKLLSKTNNIVAALKVLIPLMTIAILFVLDFHISNFTSKGFSINGLQSILTALPAAGVIFSFIGYSPAVQLAGEAKNPQRSVPIAILGALTISIVIYVLLQIAFIGALRPTDFATGWANLNFKGDAGPFAGIAIMIGVIWLAKLIYAGAFAAPFGTGLIYTASTARMTYATGENGYLPNILHKLNSHGVPARIIAVNYFVGLFLFLPFPTWQRLVGFLVSCLVFAYAVGPLALLVLRRTMPDQPRTFKLPLPRLMCILAFYISNLIVYWTGWHIISKMLIAIVIGYGVLFLFKLSARGKALNLQWRKGWWIIPHLIIFGIISYLGAFGGGLKWIPFGWDFLVIAMLTVLTYEASLYFALRK